MLFTASALFVAQKAVEEAPKVDPLIGGVVFVLALLFAVLAFGPALLGGKKKF